MPTFKPWRISGDRNRPFWLKMCNTWSKIVFSDWIIAHDFSSLEFKDWNPWKDWCKSWDEFQSSEEKPPKSKKQKAAIFADLSTIAKVTSEKLEEAKTMRTALEQKSNENEKLRNQNSVLKMKCDELQHQLDAEKEKMIDIEFSNMEVLEKEAELREALELEKKNLILRVQQKEEELKMAADLQEAIELEKKNLILRGQQKEEELKMEVDLREALELEKKNLILKVQKKEEEFQRDQVERREMGETLSSLQGLLLERRNKYQVQVNIKNFIINFYGQEWNGHRLHAQLKNGEEENSLDRESLREVVDKLGRITSLNVFDWLCSFEVEYQISKWSGKDIEQILHRCMDTSNFSSLLPVLKMADTTWLDMCKHIARGFIPDLDDLLDTEQMREDDKVLQYFHRMWMIYRITENSDVSKEDPKYMNAICEGLLPHLYEEVKYLCDEDYEAFERAALVSEHCWLVSEKDRHNWIMKIRKAGAGCPSRMKIWKRLQKYTVPYRKIHEAPYWNLLVYLSRYEDLETREPRV